MMPKMWLGLASARVTKKGPLARPGVHQVEDSCRRHSQKWEDGDQMRTLISEAGAGGDHK